MTSCVGETLQDWDIRMQPGDGGDKRPQNGGDTLRPFRHGRDRSSSRAELREEVPEPSDYECTSVTGPKPNKVQTLA
jgi:hypothetical protein